MNAHRTSGNVSVTLAIGSMILVGALALGSASGQEMGESVDENIFVSSRMVAALVVAYEDLGASRGVRGSRLEPASFAAEFGPVRCVKRGETYEISFLPASRQMLGGGVTYLVDGKDLRIRERRQER